MLRRKSIGTACLAITLSMAGGAAWATPQGQQQTEPNTKAEYNAFQTIRGETDLQAKIKLLSSFEMDYPDSVLILESYQEHYLAYFRLKNYAQTVEYADKFLALGAKIGQGMRIQGLGLRAQAYCMGSGDTLLQTSDDYVKARGAAAQGIETLRQWQKPTNMADQQFSASKENLGKLFNSVLEFADAGLKGDVSAGPCKLQITPDPPSYPPSSLAFDHMISDLKTEQQKSPGVR